MTSPVDAVTGLKPYPAYKDSGVLWLGEVPEHWAVVRNKLFLQEIIERSEDGLEDLLTVSQYSGVTLRRERVTEENELLTHAASLEGYKCVRQGDLVINIMLAWNGSLGVSAVKGIVSPAYCVYRSTHLVVPRFLHYLFRTHLFTGVFKTVSTGVVDSRLRLYPDVFLSLPSIVPPPPEQAAIVRYLTHVDRQIQQYIRAKQKLIKLLEEQKQAIIQKAVTRGLDPNVRLRPSGVERLGDVPEHWDVRRIATLSTKLTNGWVGPTRDILVESGVPYIQSLHIKRGDIRFVRKFFVRQEWLDAHQKIRLRASDVVVVQTGDIGQVACVPQEFGGAGCHALIIIRTNPSIMQGRYLDAVLRSSYGYESLKWLQTGALHPHLNCTWVREIFVPVPSLAEQHKIIAEIGRQTAALVRAINNLEREVILLRELQGRLISDTVTGKNDVRDLTRGLPAVPEAQRLADEAEGLSQDEESDEADGLEAQAEEVDE